MKGKMPLPVKHKPFNRAQVKSAANYIRKLLKPTSKQKFLICGGYRRQQKWMRDLDILTTIPLNIVAKRLHLIEKVKRTRRRLRILVPVNHKKIPTDIVYSDKKSWIYGTLYLTGNGRYNVRLRMAAKRKGWLLNQYGLYNLSDRKPVKGSMSVKSERDIQKLIGSKIRSPSQREV
jgi:DNA polymerase (family 10)